MGMRTHAWNEGSAGNKNMMGWNILIHGMDADRVMEWASQLHCLYWSGYQRKAQCNYTSIMCSMPRAKHAHICHCH